PSMPAGGSPEAAITAIMARSRLPRGCEPRRAGACVAWLSDTVCPVMSKGLRKKPERRSNDHGYDTLSFDYVGRGVGGRRPISRALEPDTGEEPAPQPEAHALADRLAGLRHRCHR